MSIQYSDSDYIEDDGGVDWAAFVEDHRDVVERLADSDRQVAWVCQRLLNHVDGGDQS